MSVKSEIEDILSSGPRFGDAAALTTDDQLATSAPRSPTYNVQKSG